MLNKSAKENIVKTVISPNLLPSAEKELLCYDIISGTIKRILALSSGLVVIFWLLGGALLLKIDQEKRTYAEKLSTEVEAAKLKELNIMTKELKEAKKTSDQLEKMLDRQYLWSALLLEIVGIIPQGVVLTSIETVSEQPGWIRLRGMAEERDKFLDFKQKLGGSGCCEKLESPLSNYILAKSMEFEMLVKLKNWEPEWGKNMKKKAVEKEE